MESKLSIDRIGRESQERMASGDVAARRHNGLPLIIGVVRSMRTADQLSRGATQDTEDRAVMVELYRERAELGLPLFEDN